MRTVTKKINVYKYNEANAELKEKIKNNFHLDGFLYECCMEERVETLKKLAEILDGDLDYSLSCVPDRSEFITISPKNEKLDFKALWEVIDVEKDCPLTGVCYDHDIIDHFSKYNMTVDGLNNALNIYIESIHSEYESMFEDEYLIDLCEANEYEFTEDGKIF